MKDDLYGSGEVGSALILGVSWMCTCGNTNVWMFDHNSPRAYRDDTVYRTTCIHCGKPYHIETGLLTIDIVIREEGNEQRNLR